MNNQNILQILNGKKEEILNHQKKRFDYIMTINDIIVPSQNVAHQEIKQIASDADIYVHKITGTFEERDASTIPLNANFTDDIKMQIKDSATGDTITDFVNLATMLSPGRFGNTLRQPFPLNRMFQRNGDMELNFLYGNSNANYTCKVNLTFFCQKFKAR